MRTSTLKFCTAVALAAVLLPLASNAYSASRASHRRPSLSTSRSLRKHLRRKKRVKRFVKRVTATGYCLGPCRRCETQGLTARGTRCVHGVAVARRGPLRALPMGSKVYVPGYGWARVDDVGGKVRSNQLDLRFSSHRVAKKWGKRQVQILALWSPEPQAP